MGLFIRYAWLSAALLLLSYGCGDEAGEPAPTVGVVHGIRGELSIEGDSRAERVEGAVRVEVGARVQSGADGRGTLRLDSGGFMLFDRSTSLVVDLLKVEVESGRIWLDVLDAEETTVETEKGTLSAEGAAFAVEVRDGRTEVYCGAGEITYRSPRGDGRLAQGETLTLSDSEPDKKPAEMWDDWTGGFADPTRHAPRGRSYIGVLAGRRIGDVGKARAPLPIRGHQVTATVLNDLAETEVRQTFFNAQSDPLEAEYTIRVPEGAIIQAFAVDTGAGFVEAQVGTMAATNGYELSWLEPTTASSRLTYDGPGSYRARIHPVMPGATVQVRIRYTSWLERRGDMRTYVYPMHSGSTAPLIGEFVLELDATGANVGAYRAGMGARTDEGRVVLRESDFRPHADFYVDLIDAEARPEEGARAFLVDAPEEAGPEGEEHYVLVDIPTAEIALEGEGEAPPLELAIVLDVSGATEPEQLELMRTVVDALLRQLPPSDRVTLRLADVTAHAPEGAPLALVEATDETRTKIVESLARVELGGATDLAQSLRESAMVVAGRPRGAVLYIGDGIPTTGALDATQIQKVLASIDAPPRFFALATGDGANIGLLRALFGEQSQLVRDRTEATHAVLSFLAEAARPTLRGVTVDLGEGIERVFPRPPLAVEMGSHLRLVGRLRDELPQEISVRGHRDGRPFDQTLALTRVRIQDRGDIRRRWASARLAELLDEDAGREALVELGVRFGIVTPWTSFEVGGGHGALYNPIRGFERDPSEAVWPLTGGTRSSMEAVLGGQGWRRRRPRGFEPAVGAPEQTWVRRVREEDVAGGNSATGDGGLARAAAVRALATGERGPMGCYERKLTVRPDLSGQVQVQVEVDGQGGVRDVRLLSSTLGVSDVDSCILREVRGIRFAGSGSSVVTTVRHTYVFTGSDRAMGARRTCSDASRQSLEVRRSLWRERLAASAGVHGALGVWREASGSCELGDWQARRVLIHMMLGHVGGVANQVQLYQAFGQSSSIAPYLRSAILRNVRTPADVEAVRAGLGLDVPVDWKVFARLWKANESPEARLRLVRRWLAVIPEELDLRLRLLSLLEQVNRIPEARRLAHELRAAPLADSRVRTAVGEFWLRQDDPVEAKRVFSEIVEHTPLDPWARKRLGDLYRAHGWHDEAYREYVTLARLRPNDPAVLLEMARAAANASRLDEALRLEQRLSEAADVEADEGVAGFARLWTSVRLGRLKAHPSTPEVSRAIARRERSTGVLRDPPAILVAITWEHPDDRPELLIRHPSTAEEVAWERAEALGPDYGIEAARIRDREDGKYLIELRREERDRIRPVEAELMVVIHPGMADEKILIQPITLTREERRLRFELTVGDELLSQTIPAPERG